MRRENNKNKGDIKWRMPIINPNMTALLMFV